MFASTTEINPQSMKNIKTSKTQVKALFLGLILAYRIVLDIAYIVFDSAQYSYMGHILKFNLLKYIISYVYTILIIAFIPKNKNDSLPQVFLHLQLMFMLLPMLSMYGLADKHDLYILVIVMAFFLQICILSIKKKKNTKLIETNFKKEETYKIHYRVATIMSMVFLFVSIIILILNIVLVRFPTIKAFDFSYIYTLRLENEVPTFLIYLTNWAVSLFLPFILVVALKYKKLFLIILAVIVQVLFYMINGHKSFLFSLFLTLGVWLFFKKKIFLKTCYICIILAIISSLILFIMSNELKIIPDLIVNRILFIPASIKFDYYDFFSVNPKVFFADGIIGKVLGIESPYDLPITYLIGQHYAPAEWGLENSNSNAGYWADAYANVGFFGIFLFSVLLAIIVKFISALKYNIGQAEIISIFAIYLIILNDGALLTTLVTNGLILFIGAMFLYSQFVKRKIFTVKKLCFKNVLSKRQITYLKDVEGNRRWTKENL